MHVKDEYLSESGDSELVTFEMQCNRDVHGVRESCLTHVTTLFGHWRSYNWQTPTFYFNIWSFCRQGSNLSLDHKQIRCFNCQSGCARYRYRCIIWTSWTKRWNMLSDILLLWSCWSLHCSMVCPMYHVCAGRKNCLWILVSNAYILHVLQSAWIMWINAQSPIISKVPYVHLWICFINVKVMIQGAAFPMTCQAYSL